MVGGVGLLSLEESPTSSASSGHGPRGLWGGLTEPSECKPADGLNVLLMKLAGALSSGGLPFVLTDPSGMLHIGRLPVGDAQANAPHHGSLSRLGPATAGPLARRGAYLGGGAPASKGVRCPFSLLKPPPSPGFAKCWHAVRILRTSLPSIIQPRGDGDRAIKGTPRSHLNPERILRVTVLPGTRGLPGQRRSSKRA